MPWSESSELARLDFKAFCRGKNRLAPPALSDRGGIACVVVAAVVVSGVCAVSDVTYLRRSASGMSSSSSDVPSLRSRLSLR